MYTIWLAGSTERTKQVAQTLLIDKRFLLTKIITPAPKKIGRKQILTNNPLHQFALENKVSVTLIPNKLDSVIKSELESQSKPDLLLVVDFGLLVPKWLLALPKIAPLNIHPSMLPSWRGSTPGPSVLLSGETDSGVTLMIMNEKMDEGPILKQLPFKVGVDWTQTEYYQTSFRLICANLGDLLTEFITGNLIAIPQPMESPTPTAQKITKEQAFRPWNMIQQAMDEGILAQELERASRAYSPWPKLWTIVPTSKGDKRLIIHKCKLDERKYLQLELVQIEGKEVAGWNETKNAIII
ncbi:MAG: hypothetical protein COU63_04655 [Candidatus Pacebacteria bacterium CG10_big_fil_rev_8_21_14_0_10_36_11]|nr:hypothetical protein [Candidatus Pacearchaeota archaeon]OIP74000.1 MAG: hypothetical protein AUK08_01960 [Candidatus Pacebacteria bacterium CG2_30_36_39]PIR64360.1 MAG: hypothetical protein COU63_04655 [Candidatus Pacebacteria bacterium CG10_big_fil_rev_8_21_14_0_10_36_11]